MTTVEYKRLHQDTWDERPEDCPKCLRHQSHTWSEHHAALQRNDECSYPDEPEYNP